MPRKKKKKLIKKLANLYQLLEQLEAEVAEGLPEKPQVVVVQEVGVQEAVVQEAVVQEAVAYLEKLVLQQDQQAVVVVDHLVVVVDHQVAVAKTVVLTAA